MSVGLPIDPDYGEIYPRADFTAHHRAARGERALRWTCWLARAIEVARGEAARNHISLDEARRRIGASIKQQWSRRNQ